MFKSPTSRPGWNCSYGNRCRAGSRFGFRLLTSLAWMRAHSLLLPMRTIAMNRTPRLVPTRMPATNHAPPAPARHCATSEAVAS